MGKSSPHTENWKEGMENDGNPAGTSPTIRTPYSARSNIQTKNIPKITATRGPGKKVLIFLPNLMIAIPTIPIPKVSQWTSPILSANAAIISWTCWLFGERIQIEFQKNQSSYWGFAEKWGDVLEPDVMMPWRKFCSMCKNYTLLKVQQKMIWQNKKPSAMNAEGFLNFMLKASHWMFHVECCALNTLCWKLCVELQTPY